ncbi:MAG TPA: hypothetical protein VNM45_14020 [Bacillus sp. (in: firmicutes)]|nr:hypothetical protein [Bacillus sp. (in: firmicutes)]
MNIINEQEIEKMFEALHPRLDESNLLITGDESLSKIFKHYLFLQQCAQEIIANFSFTYEEILYSQYYWFVYFKNHYFSKVGYDAGIDQQAFILMENLSNELDGEIDWELIEDIENQLKIDNK